MAPGKSALAMLCQPFVLIKTKRVWFNETGAGVVHARLGRGVRPRHGMGRRFSAQQAFSNQSERRSRALRRQGLRALRATPQAVSPSPRGGPLVTLRCDPAAAHPPAGRHLV
jgi:hypothetical protein